MSIYLHAAQRPSYWNVSETQSSKNKERTKHIGQMALAIISALGALLTLTLTIAIPIAIGIVIGAIYFSRKNREPAATVAPPPYPENQAAPSEEPPPYQESVAPSASFWDPSEYRSEYANKVSQTDVQDKLLNYSSTDESSVSMWFHAPERATAFLQYVDHMTQFAKIGTYRREKTNYDTTMVTFTPFPKGQQPNKQTLSYKDVLACLGKRSS